MCAYRCSASGPTSVLNVMYSESVRAMAGIVETIADAPAMPGERDRTLKGKASASGVSCESQKACQTHDGGDWSARNGSLPLPVPTATAMAVAAAGSQAGPVLHQVESSTTDSGVSNASSVTSDSVPAEEEEEEEDEGSQVTTELRLELRTVEQALRRLNEEKEEEGGVVVSPSRERGKERVDEEPGGNRLDMNTREDRREDGTEEEGGDRSHSCAVPLDSSDVRQEGTQQVSGSHDTTTSPLSSSASYGTQPLNYLPLSDRAAAEPDTVQQAGGGGEGESSRRSSLGPSRTSPRGLRAVFSRSGKSRLSYVGSVDARSQGMLAASSTTGLIQQGRPQTLPAKSAAEERRHQKLYDGMLAAARKKELQKAKEMIEKEKQKRQRDKMVADSLREWQKVLPNWESMKKTRRVRELWWLGLPPGVRGDVWKRAIGNDLNISPELYQISLSRCRERLASMELSRSRSDSSGSLRGINREQSVEVIHLDVSRTFPTLGFFQEGGPYNQVLHDVLGAYACYRPDVGYVQGMSFLAAVLLLNMEASDAFICLANLLNRSSYLAFFRVDHDLMRPYFSTFTSLLQEWLPRVHDHFAKLEFSPEYYLIEWIFTMYTRTFPLDVACRVWDLFCRDGDCFLFRTALGVLRLFQSEIVERHTIEEVGQFLGHLPDNSVDGDRLFQHISTINLTAKKFSQCLQQNLVPS